ncbi:MAG: hypothetical protein E7160_00585 [Firmicutes bacterium]|nr:hypothetical protein [Bacillota bacterium]
MLDIKDNNLLIICPNEEKMKLLDSFNSDNKLYNIKFMTKKEFIDNYYYKYTDEAIFYLMNKYNYDIDVCKVYLNNLYVIDIDKEYISPKLNFLKELKKELIYNKLLIFNKAFKNIIKDKKIIVKNYYELEKYEEIALNYNTKYENIELNKQVVECNTLEEEVNYVCLKIIELLSNGVDINKIYLTNISNEYLYTLEKLFSYYNIPINIKFKKSICSTKVISDYLTNNTIDLEDSSKNIINKKLINIISDLSNIDETSPIYKTILIDKLKNSYLPSKKLINAVNIKDLYNEDFLSDEYVFVLGFNQDVLPKIEKDINYITDKEKDEVDLYTTKYLNKRSKLVLTNILSNIDNLFLSYKLSSPFSNYYKSSLIDEKSLEIIKPEQDLYTYSDIYNKLRLGEYLDNYYLYGTKSNDLNILNTHYKIPYKEYKNNYTNINEDTYLKNLPYPLNLSYTSLNTYNECKFKYYLKYVLKLEEYEDKFPAFIGSMYHKILSLYRNNNFDLEEEYRKYLETRELSLKEKLLLVRIKKDLELLIDKIRKQNLLTGYNDEYYEKKLSIKLDKKVDVNFIGYIDKIMYYQKIEDTYFSIVDYKTGNIDTHIEPMKYGLHMQLPVYLYLIHYSKVFKSPIFTGIYYQNILFNYPTWSKNLEKEKESRYLLQGYSTDETSVLERFDTTYEKSELIKSMSYTEEKGFSRYSKIIDNDTLYNLVKYTKNYIDNQVDKILDRDFEIDPKEYNKESSCGFCKFKDICYMEDKDIKQLDKVEDLSFLGGEE